MPARSIDTDMWSDPRIDALGATGKLVFLRLVTGPETTSAGVTRIAPVVLGAALGIRTKDAERAIEELVDADLVRRYDGWLWMPKFIHYQLSGPMFIRSVRRAMRGLPDALATAIDRALVTKVGPLRARPKDDKPPTGKGSSSGGKRVRPQTNQGPTLVSQESEGEKYQDQDQDQDQDQPPLQGGVGPSESWSSPTAPGGLGGPPATTTNGQINGELPDPIQGDGLTEVLERAATGSEVMAKITRDRALRSVPRRGPDEPPPIPAKEET